MSGSVSHFGANTYSYMRSHGAADCLARLAELGFREFELMVHPGHLWPAELFRPPGAAICAAKSSATAGRSPRSTCRTSTSTLLPQQQGCAPIRSIC